MHTGNQLGEGQRGLGHGFFERKWEQVRKTIHQARKEKTVIHVSSDTAPASGWIASRYFQSNRTE